MATAPKTKAAKGAEAANSVAAFWVADVEARVEAAVEAEVPVLEPVAVEGLVPVAVDDPDAKVEAEVPVAEVTEPVAV